MRSNPSNPRVHRTRSAVIGLATLTWAALTVGTATPTDDTAPGPLSAAQAQILQQQINAKKAQVTTLKNQVASLQTINTNLQGQDTTLQNQVASI